VAFTVVRVRVSRSKLRLRARSHPPRSESQRALVSWLPSLRPLPISRRAARLRQLLVVLTANARGGYDVTITAKTPADGETVVVDLDPSDRVGLIVADGPALSATIGSDPAVADLVLVPADPSQRRQLELVLAPRD
jgi:hypothetical protein